MKVASRFIAVAISLRLRAVATSDPSFGNKRLTQDDNSYAGEGARTYTS